MRINDSHCDGIHSSLTTVRCFDNGYVGKQAVAWNRILCGVLVEITPWNVRIGALAAAL